MRIILVFIILLLHLLAAPHNAVGDGSQADEWLGIGGLRIVDVHHTEGYLRGVMNLSGENGTGWIQPSPPGQPMADVAGVWTISFEGEDTMWAEVTLHQADGEVFGEGAMTSRTGTRLVTAAGYVGQSQLDLWLVTVGYPSLFRVRLSLLTSPASGGYAVYSPAVRMGFGTATGYKAAALGDVPPPRSPLSQGGF
ncbi:hypothetical protein P0O24_07710 [Methanotrichaceae archaeon M04Ac]|jgi:hypothetical protein|uniref:Uncharacterized protein n=1 Tax=Candidatus Methanocrinis alkalitolerans TaxID=3033395 RepID=A0ABT5XFR0_9EURY|nr:hypothetical protein [Candidatus Methanocrinis alkalitolerans]MCR3883084.1 hypothetical protein [Methanothrix sp.]MDF0593466.1 hypothetical protein [Candidatus Methanocrinis alkalitolerans]